MNGSLRLCKCNIHNHWGGGFQRSLQLLSTLRGSHRSTKLEKSEINMIMAM